MADDHHKNSRWLKNETFKITSQTIVPQVYYSPWDSELHERELLLTTTSKLAGNNEILTLTGQMWKLMTTMENTFALLNPYL